MDSDWAKDWTTEKQWFDNRQRQEIFFSSRNVLTGSEAHRASRLTVTGGTSQGMKWPERQTKHSPTFSAEVKNERI